MGGIYVDVRMLTLPLASTSLRKQPRIVATAIGDERDWMFPSRGHRAAEFVIPKQKATRTCISMTRSRNLSNRYLSGTAYLSDWSFGSSGRKQERKALRAGFLKTSVSPDRDRPA